MHCSLNQLFLPSFSYLQHWLWIQQMQRSWLGKPLKMLYQWLRRLVLLLSKLDKNLWYSMMIWLFKKCIFKISCIQMARLQNSMIFKAASSLDFQRDMIGSINMLLCEKQSDFNSTNMTISFRSPRQMANNRSNFIMSNSSGKYCCKLLYETVLSHSACVLIICLHFSFTIL